MRKHYFLFSILVLSLSLSLPQTLRGQQPSCMPNSSINPSNYVPFTSVYYISGPDEAGDLLVVGSMTAASYSGLSGVPLPNANNQQFCNPITLAPGIVANAYVPTVGEKTGAFGNFAGILFDPTCTGEGCPYYYPNGLIPLSEIPSVFAWRIPPRQPGPPVYVSTGISNGVFTETPSGQILAVDGSSGVTSVLFTSPGIQYYDFEGLAVGPDNLIYVTCPDDALIFRIDQNGGSLETVYQKISGYAGPYEPQGPSFTTTGLLDFNTADYEGVWQISFDTLDNPSAPTEIIPPPGNWWGTGTAFNLADDLLFAEAPWGTSGPSEVFQQTSPTAGTASPLITSSLSTPIGVAVNSSGNIFVANLNNYQYSGYLNAGYIAQFDSQGNYLGNYVNFSCYSEYGPCDTPTFMQFDASGRLYVVTVQDEYDENGKVWRVDPCGSTTCMPTLLIDLSHAYSTGTVPGLNWNTAVGVALAGSGPSNSYTTPPQPVSPGTPVTYSYGNITNQTITIPTGSSLGGAASIAVNFQQWNPMLFDTNRLPATSTNTWSGGTPVPAGTTCTPIAGTGGNCIVIEDLCFDSSGKQILPCEIFAPVGSYIVLKSDFQTQASTQNLGMIIGDDNQNNWANITYSLDVTGHTNGANTDTTIVNFNLSGTAPTFSFTGAPATAAYESSFSVAATTNANATPVITATAGSVCTVGTPSAATGSATAVVTMISGTGICNLTAFSPADTTYAAAYATQSAAAAPAPLTIKADDYIGKPYGTALTLPPTAFTTSTLYNSDTVTGVTLYSAGAAAATPVGSYPIVPSNAVGTGLSNYKIGYANGTLTVVPASSTTSLISSSPTSDLAGEALTLTATVTGPPGTTTPTGTVDFIYSGVGTIASAVPLTNGVATFIYAPIWAGTATAKYSGDNNFMPSNSNAVGQTVTGAPIASIAPTEVQFVGQNVYTTSQPQPVQISNIGTAALNISSISIAGPASDDFSLTKNCPSTLPGLSSSNPAPSSCTVYVSFTPDDTGVRTATLSITDNDSLSSPQIIGLTGLAQSAIKSDFNRSKIVAGNYIWFTAQFAVRGPVGRDATQDPVQIFFTNSTVTFKSNGVSYNLPAPNAVVVFSPTATTATTTYDTVNGRWVTTVPSIHPTKKCGVYGVDTRTFLTGFALQVPSGGLPGDIEPVMWAGSFASDTPGVSVRWRWGAAVYTQFSTNYNALGVKPVEDDHEAISAWWTPDPAGTPENFKQYWTRGASGDDRDDFTGDPSRVVGASPSVAPLSLSPTELNFGSSQVGATSTTSPMTVTVTNIGAVPITITGITVTGAHASDFVIQSNSCASPLASPPSSSTSPPPNVCTLSITFTPGDVGTRSGVLAITSGPDSNIQSTQTVDLGGNGTP